LKYWRKPLDEEEVKTSKGQIFAIPNRCKGCGFCIEFCPKGVLEESTEINNKGYHPPKIVEG
jgi:2-oxoglutarate ferredoxin oxidoreductase subunit delta